MKLVHVKKTFVEEEFNCTECAFQGCSKMELRKHINLTHNKKEEGEGIIKCRICGEEFKEKWNLMKHRKGSHIGAVGPCRKFAEGNCNFQS